MGLDRAVVQAGERKGERAFFFRTFLNGCVAKEKAKTG